MMVKICGITCRQDLDAAIAAGAGAVGFNFFRKSPRYLRPSEAAELARHVSGGVLKVGVFVNEPAALIEKIAAEVGLDVAQLHGACERPRGWRIWRAYSVGDDFDPSVLTENGVEAFLLDTPAGEQYGGTGASYDWQRVAALPGRILLAGGLAPDNVAGAIRAARPWGVDACSRLESAPGKKDNEMVRAFIQNALRA